jgi:hypothetical protein
MMEFTEQWARAAYPDCTNSDDDYFSAPGSYGPIVAALGVSLVEVEAGDYQGDTWVLLHADDGHYGILTFGWGSCSGCDALQGCDSYADVAELAKGMQPTWFETAAAALEYVNTHDWQGDHCWHEDHLQEFIGKARATLELAAYGPRYMLAQVEKALDARKSEAA